MRVAAPRLQLRYVERATRGDAAVSADLCVLGVGSIFELSLLGRRDNESGAVVAPVQRGLERFPRGTGMLFLTHGALQEGGCSLLDAAAAFVAGHCSDAGRWTLKLLPVSLSWVSALPRSVLEGLTALLQVRAVSLSRVQTSAAAV